MQKLWDALAELESAERELNSSITRMQARAAAAVKCHVAGATVLLGKLASVSRNTKTRACMWPQLAKQYDDCVEEARVTMCALRAYAALGAALSGAAAAEAEALLRFACGGTALHLPIVCRNVRALRAFGELVTQLPSAVKSRLFTNTVAQSGLGTIYVDVRDAYGTAWARLVNDHVDLHALREDAEDAEPLTSTCSVVRGNIEYGMPVLHARGDGSSSSHMLRVLFTKPAGSTALQVSVYGVVLGVVEPRACTQVVSKETVSSSVSVVQPHAPHFTSVSPTGQWFVQCKQVVHLTDTYEVVVYAHAHIEIVRFDFHTPLRRLMHVQATARDTFYLVTNASVREFSGLGTPLGKYFFEALPDGTAPSRVLIAAHADRLAIVQCVRTASGTCAPRQLELFYIHSDATRDKTWVFTNIESDVALDRMHFVCDGRALLLFGKQSRVLMLSRRWTTWSWIPMDTRLGHETQCVTNKDEIVLFGPNGCAIVTLTGDTVVPQQHLYVPAQLQCAVFARDATRIHTVSPHCLTALKIE